MPATLTPEQIVALAPDASSAKSGRELASTRKWVTLGADDRAAWGECQGSGKLPYQTQIDLSEPAFKCSCPSRKFPCKHGLGLFLLLAAQADAFTQKEPPSWVNDWLATREKRAEQRAEKQERGPEPVDPAAQAKRAAQREAKVAAGLDDLQLWMRDLIRHGFAHAQSQPYSFWEAPAARLVDQQAPGAARMVREMAGIPASGPGWQERLLEQLGRVHLLVESYRRIATLPEPLQAEVRSQIGWTYPQEELLQQPPVRDTWRVLGQFSQTREEEKLRIRRTWLQGQETGRAALLLDFTHLSQPAGAGLPPGVCVEAELVFFPGAFPLRATVKQQHGQPAPLDEFPGHAAIAAAVNDYANALTQNPWLEAFPLALRGVVPVRQGQGWAVRDGEGRQLPLTIRFEYGWRLLAASGGHPVEIFGEWNGRALLPLSVLADGRLQPVAVGEGA